MRLYLHQPTVVFAARCNQSTFVYPINQVTYDTVTTGTYSVVGNSQTILFGTSAGASDLGMSRVRLDPTSTVLYFGLSPQGSHIGEVDLADNCYITVLDQLLVWSKPAYIDPSTAITYMDGIAYTNQNSFPQPVANAGPPFAATIDPGTGLITVDLSAADSFAVTYGATLASYLWDIQDGTVTAGDIDEVSLTVTFPAGFRYISVLVVDSNAKAHTAYVPILAIDPDDDPTIDAFQITRHTITASGQELDIRLLENVSTANFPEGGFLMVIDGEPLSAVDRDNVLFWGWADTEETDIDAGDTGLLRDTTIHCLDVANRMKQLLGSAQVITVAATPAQWAEMLLPNMDKFVVWLLYWQTTALALADFIWSGTGADYAFAERIADGSNLWDQADRKCQEMVPDYRLTCNRRGQIKMLPAPMFQEVADRTSTTQASITIADWQSISFTAQRRPRYWRVEGQAVIVGNTISTSVFCFAPGNSQGQGEQSMVMGENLAADQTALNRMTGHHYARLNAPQGMFTVTLPKSQNEAFDPARMDWVALTISAEVAAQRGLTFTEARFLLHQLDVRYQYTPGGIVRTNTLRLERETVGIPAVTFVPAVAEQPTDDDPFTPPDVPDAPPGFDGGLPVGMDVVGFIDRDGSIYTCPDFTTPGEPTWSRNTSAASAASITTGELRGFIVDPFSPGYRGTPGGDINGFVVAGGTIYRVTDLFGTPAYTSLHTLTTTATNSAELAQISCSFGRYQSVEADNPWLICAYHAGSGVDPMRVFVTYSTDGGATWSAEVDVSGDTRTQVKRELSRPSVWMSPRTPGLAYVGAWETTGSAPDGGLWRTVDWGATWAQVTDIDDQGIDMGLGFGMHVPWESNLDERIAFYGAFSEVSNKFNYGLWKSVAGAATDVSPASGGKKYGPVRNQFGIRALDTSSRYMLLAGAADNVDDIALLDAGSTGVTALWKSDDWGATWTRVTTDATTDVTDDCILQAAFSSDDPNTFYAWGGGGYLLYTEDGSTMDDKSPTSPSTSSEILGIFGGPTTP